MKILCPTDFSTSSLTAIKWAMSYLDEIGGGEIEILHCIGIMNRATIFKNLDNIFQENARSDMRMLIANIEGDYEKIKITPSIFKADSRPFIIQRAKDINADCIVIGTVGLSNLKDLTVGSTTEYIARHADIPVIAIPKDINYKRIQKVVFGVDNKKVKHPAIMGYLQRLLYPLKPKIYLTEVVESSNEPTKTMNHLDTYLQDFECAHHTIVAKDKVSNVLNEFITEISADMLCMIHHKRNWLGRLFVRSTMKEELFVVKTPLLILPD